MYKKLLNVRLGKLSEKLFEILCHARSRFRNSVACLEFGFIFYVFNVLDFISDTFSTTFIFHFVAVTWRKH